jgi:hypothetical protein
VVPLFMTSGLYPQKKDHVAPGFSPARRPRGAALKGCATSESRARGRPAVLNRRGQATARHARGARSGLIRRRLLAAVIGAPLLVVLVLAVSACGSKNINPGIDDDALVTARVKTALLNDAQIGITKIDVTTVDRVVTLSGPVKSKADEERAVQIARGVSGVGDVRSALRIGD